MDLSPPHGSSINDFIPRDDYTLHYASFDEALTLVARYGQILSTHSACAQFAWKMASFLGSTGKKNSTLIFASPLVCDSPHTALTA